MTAHDPLTNLIAAVVDQHFRGDWSDRTYTCQGCSSRFEEQAQERFDAMDRDPTREELVEFRNQYARRSKPDWTRADYHDHLAVHLAASVRAWLTTDPNSPLAAVSGVTDDIERYGYSPEYAAEHLRAALTATHPTKEQQP